MVYFMSSSSLRLQVTLQDFNLEICNRDPNIMGQVVFPSVTKIWSLEETLKSFSDYLTS